MTKAELMADDRLAEIIEDNFVGIYSDGDELWRADMPPDLEKVNEECRVELNKQLSADADASADPQPTNPVLLRSATAQERRTTNSE